MGASRAIRHRPKVSPLAALRTADPAAASWSDWGQLLSRGRDALYLIYRRLKPGPWSVAWFPSFHCGVEVQAAVAAGWQVDFFPVDRNLRVDRRAIRSRMSDRPGPLTLIHYFGHPARDRRIIADECRRHQVPLIEDACHGPLGQGATGPYSPCGDAVAFSLRKVLGTPDGGMLRLFPDRLAALSGAGDDASTSPGSRRLRPLLNYGLGLLGLGSLLGSPPASLGKTEERPADSMVAGGGYGRRISVLSEHLVRAVDARDVVEGRRANWLGLRSRLEGVSGFRPLYEELADEAVPLSFAVRVARRDQLVRELHRVGIGCYVFGRWNHPTLPAGSYPDARCLRHELLGLPVHHGLTPGDLDRMSRVLRDLLPVHNVEKDEDGSGGLGAADTSCAR